MTKIIEKDEYVVINKSKFNYAISELGELYYGIIDFYEDDLIEKSTKEKLIDGLEEILTDLNDCKEGKDVSIPKLHPKNIIKNVKDKFPLEIKRKQRKEGSLTASFLFIF